MCRLVLFLNGADRFPIIAVLTVNSGILFFIVFSRECSESKYTALFPLFLYQEEIMAFTYNLKNNHLFR